MQDNTFFKKKNVDYLIALTGYFLIALFILNRIIFFSPGTIGFFHDWFIGPYPEMNRLYADGGFYIWNSQLGNKIYPTDWIFRLILIPFSFLGGEVLTKGLLIVIITLSGFGAFCLGKRLKLSPYSSFAAGVLYTFSPIIFTRIIAGHIYYLVAYFLSPFVLSFFLKGKEDEEIEEGGAAEKQKVKNKSNKIKIINYKYFIIAGILTSLAVIQIQFLVMLFIVLLVFTLVDFGKIKRSALGLVVVFSITFLINLSPVVLSQTIVKTPNSYFNPVQLLSNPEIGSAVNLSKSLRLLGYEIHPYSYTRIGSSQDPLFGSDIKGVGNNNNNNNNNNKPDLVSNSAFILAGNNQSSSLLPTNWNDPHGNCNNVFGCTVINSKSVGWQNNNNNTNSFKASTNTTKTNTWSSIYGKEIDVKPNENYAIITNMKLNKFAVQSHVAMEGYSAASKMWYPFKTQCPSGTNGPLEWHEYTCAITIPKDTSMIRPVLRAGWSSQPGKEAVTLFNAIDIFKLNDTSVIIPSWVFYLDFLLPIVGFSALIFRKDKYILSFAVISLVGLFLMKGLNPPFPSIFNFIFTHGFFVFRELWHVAFLYGFGISFLIAFSLDRMIIVLSKIKNYSSIHKSFYLRFYKLRNIIFSSVLISLIVISNGYPLLRGDFGGYLQTYTFPKEYHAMYGHLLTNSTFNTLILPLFSPIKYGGLKLEGLDPLLLDSADNILYQVGYRLTSDPISGISTWLHSVMQENKTENFGKLLSGFGIKYIVLRKDFISNYPRYVPLGTYPPFIKRWYLSVEPFLDNQKDLVVISNTSNYKVYKNTIDAKKIFDPLVTVTGLSDFNDLVYISNFTSLSNAAAYQFDYDTKFSNSDNTEQSNRAPYDFIDLGQYAPSFDASEGWTTNRDWFGFNYLLASRVHVGAFTMANNSAFSFDLPHFPKYANKHIELWMKAFTWPNGNLISININGKGESLYDLYSHDSSFSLIKIFDGNYTNSNYHFLIRNIVGKNYVEGIYIKEKGIEREDQISKDKIFAVGIEDQNNLVSNPDFRLTSNGQSSNLPLYWIDSFKNCDRTIKCNINSTTGWKDNNNTNTNNIKTSFQISTNKTTNRWSYINGKEIGVKSGEQYAFITHMKLNKFAVQSHVSMEGYNITSKMWYPFKTQCPSGTNGPLEWHEYTCAITIPKDTSMIRPILNAGWSSQPGKEAVTFFDDIKIFKPNIESRVQDISQIKKQVILHEQSPSPSSPIIKKYSHVNPTLWNVHMNNNSSKPFTLSFAEPYDASWEARVYKDGKEVDVAKAAPLYGVINGFQIYQPGSLDIVLRYARQDWFETGMMISALTFAFCMIYLFYDWRRCKQDKWTEKIEMKVWQLIRKIKFARI